MEDEIDFRDYLVVLRKNIPLIIFVFLIVFTCAIYYNMVVPPSYESRSLLVVNSQDEISLLLPTNAPRIDMETHVEVIKSASVLGWVYNEITGEYDVEINLIKNSDVIEIMVMSTNKQIAMEVANAVADRYVVYTLESRENEAKFVNDFISVQIDEYQKELDILTERLSLYKNVNMTSAQQADYNSIVQSIKAKEELYNYLLSRREEVNIVAQEKSANVKIIEEASLPLFPSKPNYLLNLIIAFGIAVVLSLGLALAREAGRNALDKPKDIQRIYKTNILGRIKKQKKGKAHVGGSKDEFTDSIEIIGTKIEFALKDSGIKSIAVASPGDREGKSLVASNLAITLANQGLRVLLVDADFRDPSLANIFKTKSTGGLMDVMAGKMELASVIKATRYEGLDIIHHGKTETPLNTVKLQQLYSTLTKKNYDAIISDCESLRFSEGLAMAGIAQTTLMIVAFDKTRVDAAEESMVSLEKVRANILGVVINFFR